MVLNSFRFLPFSNKIKAVSKISMIVPFFLSQRYNNLGQLKPIRSFHRFLSRCFCSIWGIINVDYIIHFIAFAQSLSKSIKINKSFTPNDQRGISMHFYDLNLITQMFVAMVWWCDGGAKSVWMIYFFSTVHGHSIDSWCIYEYGEID